MTKNALLAKQPNSIQVHRKRKIVTAHATTAHGERRGIAPLMLNLWQQAVVTTLRSLYRQEGAHVGERHSQSGRFQRREKSLASIGIRNADRPLRGTVTILTELSRLLLATSTKH
jgi:hypothetical protein